MSLRTDRGDLGSNMEWRRCQGLDVTSRMSLSWQLEQVAHGGRSDDLDRLTSDVQRECCGASTLGMRKQLLEKRA